MKSAAQSFTRVISLICRESSLIYLVGLPYRENANTESEMTDFVCLSDQLGALALLRMLPTGNTSILYSCWLLSLKNALQSETCCCVC